MGCVISGPTLWNLVVYWGSFDPDVGGYLQYGYRFGRGMLGEVTMLPWTPCLERGHKYKIRGYATYYHSLGLCPQFCWARTATGWRSSHCCDCHSELYSHFSVAAEDRGVHLPVVLIEQHALHYRCDAWRLKLQVHIYAYLSVSVKQYEL